MIYQVAKINLVNNEYDFITKIDDKFYFKNYANNLILVNKASVFIVYSYNNSNNLRTDNTTSPDSIPVNLSFHWSLNELGIKPLSDFKPYIDMSRLERYRAIFYSDLVFACAQAGIDYKVFEKITSFLPKVDSKAQQSQLLDKASHLIKDEGVPVRFKDKISQHWTFLKPNTFVEFDELEYLHKQTNQWLPLTLN